MIQPVLSICLLASWAASALLDSALLPSASSNVTCPFTVRCDPFREVAMAISDPHDQEGIAKIMTQYLPDLVQSMEDDVFDDCCWSLGIRQCFMVVFPEKIAQISSKLNSQVLVQALLPALDHILSVDLPASCDLTASVQFEANKTPTADPLREDKLAYYRSFLEIPSKPYTDLYNVLRK